MCNLNKIGLLIGAASAPIIVAVVFLAASFINANSLYTVLGNGIVLGVSAVFLVLSSSSIALAIKEVDGCVQGRCSALAETLRNALIAIGVSLAIAITAVIIGMLFGSIPYVGGGVCTVVGGQLNALQTCLFASALPATGVVVGGVLTTVATIMLAAGYWPSFHCVTP